LFHVDSFLFISINSYYHQIYYTHYIENNQYRKYIVFVISESWRKGKLSQKEKTTSWIVLFYMMV